MTLPMVESRYTARAVGAAQFEMSGNGNMQIAIPFEIVSEDETSGELITWFATLHDTADKTGKTGRERVIESLVAMGWQGDDMTELVDIDDATARRLMPEVVELVCQPEEYDGKWRLKVKWVNRPGAGRAGFKKPLNKDELRSFAAQMRSTVRGVRGASGQQRSQAQRPANNTGGSRPQAARHPNAPDDDNVPFVTSSIDDEPSPIARAVR